MRRRWRPSITFALTAGFGSLMLLAMAAVSLVTLRVAERNTRELLGRTAEVTLDGLVAQIDQQIAAVENQARFVARRVAAGEPGLDDPRGLARLMQGSLAAVPQALGLAVLSSDGWALRIAREGIAAPVAETDWRGDPRLAALMGQLADPEWRPERGLVWIEELRVPGIAVRALILRDGRALGIVTCVVGIQDLSRFAGELSERYGFSTFLLEGRDGVLAHPALQGGLRGLSARQLLPRRTELQDPVLAGLWEAESRPFEGVLPTGRFSGRLVSASGEDWIVLTREIPGTDRAPWIVGAYLPAARATLPLQRLAWAAAIALAIVLLALVAAALLGRAIARPVRRLAEAAEAVSRLDLAEVPVLRRSLLAELDAAGRAYNAMLGGLRWFETYVPKLLVVRLMRLGPSAGRSLARDVTVLFTDIVGFTSLSEHLTPQQTADFLNRHFALLAGAIEAEGGLLDKYIGDCVMAFWGAPVDEGDHAGGACRAALGMRQAIEADNAERRAAGLRPVRLRIGIHSGPAVVGNIGAPGRVNYTLVGDTVNTAQRLEALARDYLEPEEEVAILASAATARLVEREMLFSPLGAMTLRGRGSPTEVLRLLGPRSNPP